MNANTHSVFSQTAVPTPSAMTLNVVELFSSIEGEGSRQGFPCSFLRLYDCNIRCSYCDTTYSYDGAPHESMTLEEVAHALRQMGHPYITITGGEPLLQAPAVVALIKMLSAEGSYEFNIETNGTLLPPLITDNVFYTYDYKCPSSLVEDMMNLDVFQHMTSRDVLKFVVGSIDDLYTMKDIIATYHPIASVFVSPVFGAIEPKTIVEFLLEHKLDDVRVQLQIHKFIWDPSATGV